MTRMLPLKAVLLSSGVVSMAVILKLSLPIILDFLVSELPLFWSLALSWLRPPYLYLLINCIIISIVASTKLQPHGDGRDIGGESVTPVPEKEKIPAVVRDVAPMDTAEEDMVVFGYVESPIAIMKEDRDHHLVTPPLKTERARGDDEEGERFDEGDGFVLSKLVWNSPETPTPAVAESSPVASAEKPPFSARFGHRRAVKASPEGKAVLKVSRPKKQETLESTWRTITEGRSMPLTRHLRKADTFAVVSPEGSPVRVMKKSDTFSSGNSSRRRREPSLGQDELNRRVEAFIKKFNEEMRLQRQESQKQFSPQTNKLISLI